MQRERGERPDPGVVPAQLGMPPHGHHVIGEDVAEPGRREQLLPPLGWDRLRMLPGELQRGNIIHANSPCQNIFETLERPVDQRTGHPGVAGRIEQSGHVGAGHSGLLQRDGEQVGEIGTVPLGRRGHLGQ